MNSVDLRLGNCYEELKKIPDKSIDLIYTDPPYDYRIFNVEKEEDKGTTEINKRITGYLTKVDDITARNYDLIAFCNECMRIMKEPNIYVWCNKAQVIDYLNFFVNEHHLKYQILIWFKTNALPTYSNKYLDDCEYCLYFYSTGKCYPKNYKDAQKVYTSPLNADSGVWGHPTIKPLDFVRSHISNSTRPGDIILDPFMGSGTTGLAVKQLGEDRKFIGIEINPEYIEIAKMRIDGYEKPIELDKQSLW